jgi:hypothetical protein
MKPFNARGLAALVGAVVLMAPIGAQAASGCNLGATPCPGASPYGCGGGNPAPVSVWHSGFAPCAGGGSVNLTGTQYAMTCSNFGGSCANVSVPPFRFYSYDNYSGAGFNSGCQNRNAPSSVDWYVNSDLDLSIATPGGRWLFYQANWAGPAVDGPLPPSLAGTRTVIEASDITNFMPAPPYSEVPSVNHGAWYVLASVDFQGGEYSLDRVTGVTGGCAAGDVPTAMVPSVTIQGRTLACTNDPTATTGTNNSVDGTNYGDIQVNLSDSTGQWFNETGRNAAPNLIAGFQIVYKSAPEPTSSNYATGGWIPVRDTANPTQARGIIPQGAAGPYTVTVPKAAAPLWLAARVVYSAGATANPTGTFDPATAGPQVTSKVGPHCGPVNFGGIVTAVTFDSITATRTHKGVLVRWTTSFEDDVNGFVVYRTSNPAGSTDSADAVLPWASAHGPGLAYEFLDSAATGSDPYYYVIQEQTFSGLGASSAVVAAQGLSDGGAVGGRSRGKR